MDIQSFKKSLENNSPPEGIDDALAALWHDAKGDWERAHELCQRAESKAGDRVHAYLHRKEGDDSNAAYWYRRAGCEPHAGTLESEWEEIAAALLP